MRWDIEQGALRRKHSDGLVVMTNPIWLIPATPATKTLLRAVAEAPRPDGPVGWPKRSVPTITSGVLDGGRVASLLCPPCELSRRAKPPATPCARRHWRQARWAFPRTRCGRGPSRRGGGTFSARL